MLLSFPRFNRQTDPLLESEILEVWTERVSKEPWLFNGSKFRLHSFCLASPHSASLSPSCNQFPRVPILKARDGQNSEPDCWTTGEENFSAGDSLHSSPLGSLNETNKCQNQRKGSEKPGGEESEPLLTLRLGLTCYKDYLGTNWSNRVSELCQLGETEFGDPWTFLAQPLGVGAVLCTRDHQVVLIRRSHRVAEAGGLLDIPGGHPEPKVKERQSELRVPGMIDGLYTTAHSPGGVRAARPCGARGADRSGHDGAESSRL